MASESPLRAGIIMSMVRGTRVVIIRDCCEAAFVCAIVPESMGAKLYDCVNVTLDPDRNAVIRRRVVSVTHMAVRTNELLQWTDTFTEIVWAVESANRPAVTDQACQTHDVSPNSSGGAGFLNHGPYW